MPGNTDPFDTDFDLARVQDDTPASRGQVFLDSAGSSLPPRTVIDTVITHLQREAQIGGYRAANEAGDRIAGTRASIAALINAAPADIAFSDSASRSWADLFYSVPLRPGDRVLCCTADYGSNAIATLHRARESGARVELVPADAAGKIDLNALAATLDTDVKLVSLVHVPTNSGLLNPVAEVCELAHAAGALVLVDACQSIGQVSIDVAASGIDMLTATGRKWLRGPRGTGFAYVRPDIADSLHPAMLDQGGARWTAPGAYELNPAAARFEFWEHNVAARLGLGAAARYLLDLGQDVVPTQVAGRARYLRDGLAAIPGVHVQDPSGAAAGIVTFTVDKLSPEQVRDALVAQNITVTVNYRASAQFDMTARGLDSVVRASPHYFVSPGQLDEFLAAVSALAGQA